jgi:hypothetical protein
MATWSGRRPLAVDLGRWLRVSRLGSLLCMKRAQIVKFGDGMRLGES